MAGLMDHSKEGDGEVLLGETSRDSHVIRCEPAAEGVWRTIQPSGLPVETHCGENAPSERFLIRHGKAPCQCARIRLGRRVCNSADQAGQLRSQLLEKGIEHIRGHARFEFVQECLVE